MGEYLMPRHWPYQSTFRSQDKSDYTRVLNWMIQKHGDSAYQRWTYKTSYPGITVMFSTLDQKVEFDLTWNQGE